jgi:copper resistance protein C
VTTGIRAVRARYPRVGHARGVAIVSILLAIPLGAAFVEAHARLARSEPEAASTLRSAPGEVRLWFTESLEATFSSAHLLDGARRRVDGADGKVDGANPALLRMTLPALSDGRYTVVYRVVSIDSHVTAGELTFNIAR